jgi:hypothetical protein
MASAVDPFPNNVLGPTAPAENGFAITPHDTNELAFITRALVAYTTAGLIDVVTVKGDTVRIYLALGVPFPIRARIVKTTSAVAAGISGLY